MKYVSRRDLLKSTSALTLLAIADMSPAEAWIHGGGPPFGKNQIGLNGITYFSNIYPFANWWKQGAQQQLTVTVGVTSITWVGGTATITTSVAHGLTVGTTGWGMTVAGAAPSGYNTTGFIFSITGASTITYAIANPGSSPATGTITLSYDVFQSSPPNNTASALGQNNNLNLFFDADGQVQNNIPGALSLVLQRIVYTLDDANGAFLPPGFTRAGEQITISWTGGGTVSGSSSPLLVNWTTANDTQTLSLVFNISNPANPPRNIYYGFSTNFSSWQAGNFFDATYVNMLRQGSGVIRFMDWMTTNNTSSILKFADFPSSNNAYWGSFGQTFRAPPTKASLPIAVLTQLANKTNKHPWINVPYAFGTDKLYQIIGITKSSPGSNAIVTIGTTNISNTSPTALAHNFNPGDTVIPWIVDGGGTFNSGFGVQTTVTFTIGGANCVNWTAHGFAAGQNVWFSGGTPPSNVNALQSYYVTNVTANTFQLAKTPAIAQAGTAITLAGSPSGTTAGVSQVNRNAFTVGAVTTSTIELLHCDSSSFGTLPTTGYLVTPFSPTGITTEVTNLVNAVKAQLGSQLVPRFELGNELWNSFATVLFHYYAAQAHSFVDANGVPIFPNDDGNSLTGYIIAHVMKTIRDAYGGSAGRTKWHGILATWGGVPSWTTGLFNGMDNYLTNWAPASGLTRNDLVNDIAVTAYYGGFLVSNGFTPDGGTHNYSGVTISVATPSQISTSTNTLPVGSPIMFTSSGTLPTDGATGQPLVRGDMSTPFTFTGYITAGVLTVTAVSGTPILAGMTVWGDFTSGVNPASGIQPTVIAAFGTGGTTGTGGTGTYSMDIVQTAGSVGSQINCNCMSMTKNCGVYWTLDTGTPFRFAATQGGAPINISGAGSGVHNCASGISTLVCSWMNTSVSLHASTPATFPSRYTYFNQTMNTEITTGQQSNNGFGTNTMFQEWLSMIPGAVTTGATMPSPLGMVVYEGGNGNTPNGNAPDGTSMNIHPMFNEFLITAFCTNEDAANWPIMVNQWATLPATANAHGVANALTLVTSYPSKFVDAINASVRFSFGALYFVDPVLGLGSPTWQSSTNTPVWNAIVATN